MPPAEMPPGAGPVVAEMAIRERGERGVSVFRLNLFGPSREQPTVVDQAKVREQDDASSRVAASVGKVKVTRLAVRFKEEAGQSSSFAPKSPDAPSKQRTSSSSSLR